MFVDYTNPEGASEDDLALAELLESLEVNDCFGTVTVEADEINIRDYNSTDSDIVGTARKGETYKVYSISYPNVYTGGYTWYNIGELEFIADKDGEWVEYTENK